MAKPNAVNAHEIAEPGSAPASGAVRSSFASPDPSSAAAPGPAGRPGAVWKAGPARIAEEAAVVGRAETRERRYVIEIGVDEGGGNEVARITHQPRHCEIDEDDMAARARDNEVALAIRAALIEE